MHKRLYHITDTDVVEPSLKSMSRGNRCDVTELHVYNIEEESPSTNNKKRLTNFLKHQTKHLRNIFKANTLAKHQAEYDITRPK